MGHLKLKGKDLLRLGYPGRSVTKAIAVMQRQFPKRDKNYVLAILSNILKNPRAYVDDLALGEIAEALVSPPAVRRQTLNVQRAPFATFGKEHIRDEAFNQLYTALKLPIALQGALMPDAHSGYGLPIGGVLATDNAVIPYGVGLDIGCRLSLSILDTAVTYLEGAKDRYAKALVDHTRFGMREVHASPNDHGVFESDAFRSIPLLRKLHGKAIKQFGTSGGGNHFVEFGEVTLTAPHPELDLKPGSYVGLLSHSGSRGIGASIAQYYTKAAMAQCPLPKEAQQLAWLDLDTHLGMEYWVAMQLAGEYAAACHSDIHRRLIRAVGGRIIARVEHHHNFAWKEIHEGREIVVHRKGATPAGNGVVGYIPGSMVDKGYLVVGRGHAESLHSASHGAGRMHPRDAARRMWSPSEMKKVLAQHRVTLIGGSLEEAPMAYKRIAEVMAAQKELVDIIGTFQPRIVRMDG